MRTHGFTLIEVMVTVTIIALLSIAAVSSFTQQQRRARDARRIADIESISSAIQQYKALGYDTPSTANAAGTPQIQSTTPPTQSGDPPLATSLTDLVSKGLLAMMPIEQDTSTQCLRYYYVSPTDASINSAYGGPRDYALVFMSEVAKQLGRHPMSNGLVVGGSPTPACNYYSTFLLAPLN